MESTEIVIMRIIQQIKQVLDDFRDRNLPFIPNWKKPQVLLQLSLIVIPYLVSAIVKEKREFFRCDYSFPMNNRASSSSVRGQGMVSCSSHHARKFRSAA